MIPYVEDENRAAVKPLGQNFFYVELDYGFMEQLDIPKVLADLNSSELVINPSDTTYFLGRQTVLPKDNQTGMAYWREKMFASLSRNATSSTVYFCLPADRV